jgi:hypothetical protein
LFLPKGLSDPKSQQRQLPALCRESLSLGEARMIFYPPAVAQYALLCGGQGFFSGAILMLAS